MGQFDVTTATDDSGVKVVTDNKRRSPHRSPRPHRAKGSPKPVRCYSTSDYVIKHVDGDCAHLLSCVRELFQMFCCSGVWQKIWVLINNVCL